jgi:predicted nucleotidyltransferase
LKLSHVLALRTLEQRGCFYSARSFPFSSQTLFKLWQVSNVDIFESKEGTIRGNQEKNLENRFQELIGKEANFQMLIFHKFMAQWENRFDIFWKEQEEKEILGPKPNHCFICPYGSSLNGFGFCPSDIDITILTSSSFPEEKLLKDFQSSLDSHRDLKSFFIRPYRSGFVMPVKDLKHNFRFDITVNNILGVTNTRLLASYSRLNPKIKHLGNLIKRWGKKARVRGTCFTSYALIVLCIFFFQINYGVPSLQAKPHEPKLMKICRLNHEPFLADLFFEETGQQIRNEKLDKITIVELIEEFFWFFSLFQGPELENKTISIKSGKWTERSTPFERDLWLSIEDPFDKEHNLGERVKRHSKGQYFAQMSMLRTLKELSEENMTSLF